MFWCRPSVRCETPVASYERLGATGASKNMELIFTISDQRTGRTVNTMLRGHADLRLSDIEPMLTQLIDGPANWFIDGRRIRSGVKLVEAGLRDGTILEAVGDDGTNQHDLDGKTAPASIVARIRVVDGPDSGSSWSLAPGTYVVGRSPAADLVLVGDDQVSRRHAKLDVSDTCVVVEDLNSSNGTSFRGEEISASAEVPAGERVEIGNSRLVWSAISHKSATVVPGDDGERIFNRPPRMRNRNETVELTPPSQPTDRQRAGFSIVALVLPLAIGVAMALALGRLIYLLFAAMSPAMALSGFIADRRRGGKSARTRAAEFKERAEQFKLDLETAVEREWDVLRDSFPDPEEIAAIAAKPLTRLWERRRDDPDFLEVRIGLCDRPASIKVAGAVTVPGAGQREIEPPKLSHVPAVVSLRTAGVLGVSGGNEAVQGLARWVVAQFAVLQDPHETRFVILSRPASPSDWSWAMWLPHLRPQDGSCTATLGVTDSAVAQLGAAVASVVDERLQAVDSHRTGDVARSEPSIIVVLDGAHRLRALPSVARLLQFGPSVGVYSICLDTSEERLPEECRAVASFPKGKPTQLSLRLAEGDLQPPILADAVTLDWAECVSRSLAPLRLDKPNETVGGLPAALTLLDLLGLNPPTSETIAEGWSKGGRTTAAAIGASGTGPLVVDLRRDGPHGLVAGTTGSGKSELLQTMIASLAVANRPDALSFVLVDYKGGSAFSACDRLPHTVGTVTDLDGHLTERALESLGAELRRRERLLRDAGAKDIEAYWRTLEHGSPPPALPMLPRIVMVIDEFASLVEELPG